jgi:prepilin-type N-terminal cleavage/methylation domain-containing protein
VTHRCTPTRQPASHGEAGFSFIEVLIATVVLAVSVLVYVQCIATQSKLNRAIEEKAAAVVTLGRFVERLRADTSWATLYARLRPLSAESTDDKTLSDIGVDTTLRTWPVASYYSDLGIPAALGRVTFLVQVPATEIAGVAALRENATAPRYGLPHDLNGDGVIDALARNDDHAVLPVVVRLRWERAGQQSREVVMATLLRGER